MGSDSAASAVLRSHPLIFPSLPPAPAHLDPSPGAGLTQLPGCFLKLSFYLPLLLLPRISICARNESLTSPMKATTMSTLGNQSSLTSRRQNQRKLVLKGQR